MTRTRWAFKKPRKLVVKRSLHENYKVSDDITKIEDYIIYKTNETLLELKKLAPNFNINDIKIEFSRRLTRVLGRYNHTDKTFTFNINWIEEYMDDPNFKDEIDGVIAHEVAHLVYQDHRSRWKMLCRHLGGTGERTYSNSEYITPPSKRKYVAVCPTCGAVAYRTKPPQENVIYACNACYANFKKKYGRYGSKYTFEHSKLEYKPIKNE